MTVIDQRMDLWRTETAPKKCQFGGAEILVAEHQHRVFGKGLFDPGKGLIVERPRQIDPERLGAERAPERAQFACGHPQFLPQRARPDAPAGTS